MSRFVLFVVVVVAAAASVCAASGSSSCGPGEVVRVRYEKACTPNRGTTRGSTEHPEEGTPRCQVFPVTGCSRPMQPRKPVAEDEDGDEEQVRQQAKRQQHGHGHLQEHKKQQVAAPAPKPMRGRPTTASSSSFSSSKSGRYETVLVLGADNVGVKRSDGIYEYTVL